MLVWGRLRVSIWVPISMPSYQEFHDWLAQQILAKIEQLRHGTGIIAKTSCFPARHPAEWWFQEAGGGWPQSWYGVLEDGGKEEPYALYLAIEVPAC